MRFLILLSLLLICQAHTASASGPANLASVQAKLQSNFGNAAGDNESRYVFTIAELEEIAAIRPDLPLGDRWELMRAELAGRHPGKVAKTLH